MRVLAAVAGLICALTAIAVLPAAQSANALGTTISDQASCEDEPVGGAWNSSQDNACTITSNTTIPAGDSWSIGSEIQLIIPDGVTLVIEGEIINDEASIQGSTIRIESGGAIENYGTMTLVGTNLFVDSGGDLIVKPDGIVQATFILNNAGTIDNFGSFGGSDHFIENSGTINNMAEFDNVGILRNSGLIENSGIFNNQGLLENSGTINNTGSMDNFLEGRIENSGNINNSCDAVFTNSALLFGNAVIFECPPLQPLQSSLTIDSVDLFGNSVDGVWTVIRHASDDSIVETGFTPLRFVGQPGTEYKVSVSNYDGKIFQQWDDGSTDSNRIVNLTEVTTSLIATYDTGDSLRGFTSLTHTGTTEEQPDLTVNAVSLDGNQALHMWAVIDPQSSDEIGTTYKVYMHNYQDIIFDHWEDGSTDRVRTLTISEDTTITANYGTEESSSS